MSPGEMSALGFPPAPDTGETVTHSAVSPTPSDSDGITRGTRQLSWSRLSTYNRCGKSFELSYIDELPRLPSGAALAGTAVHRVNEQLAKQGTFQDPFYVESVAAKAAVDLFTELVEEAGGPDACMWGGRKRNLKDERTGKDVIDEATGEKVKVGEDFRWMVQTIPTWVKRLGTILRRDIESGLYIVEANVEREVVVWLIEPGDERYPDGVQVRGFIDTMLLATDEGLPIVRDVKTGTMLEEMQLAVYAWLLGRLDEPLRVRTTIGQFAYLRGSTPETWVKTHDLTDLVPIVPQLFNGLLRGVDAGVFNLSPSSFCGSCWVRHGCPYGMTIDARKEE